MSHILCLKEFKFFSLNLTHLGLSDNAQSAPKFPIFFSFFELNEILVKFLFNI